mmetsp:Transcript_6657/g.20241  ORF Transcript_6657/g.20241 Transcript_6657/m.20241 type:complete len:206 (-) Transcript_6657:3244-3861(-)
MSSCCSSASIAACRLSGNCASLHSVRSCRCCRMPMCTCRWRKVTIELSTRVSHCGSSTTSCWRGGQPASSSVACADPPLGTKSISTTVPSSSSARSVASRLCLLRSPSMRNATRLVTAGGCFSLWRAQQSAASESCASLTHLGMVQAASTWRPTLLSCSTSALIPRPLTESTAAANASQPGNTRSTAWRTASRLACAALAPRREA